MNLGISTLNFVYQQKQDIYLDIFGYGEENKGNIKINLRQSKIH